MRRASALVLVALCLTAILRGQAIEFPNSPTAQVLDTGDRLGSERRARLEQELGRLRGAYGLDVMVILWDRSLPPDTGLAELAERIGETWAREAHWAVVLHIPDSLYRPTLVLGGVFFESVTGEAAAQAHRNALFRGLKERTTIAQVEALALEIGEELVFLRNRRDMERSHYLATREIQMRDRERRHQGMILRAVTSTLVALLAVGAVAMLCFLKRRPSNREFPQTRWRRRLGGEWCGGGHIVVSVPNRTS